MNESHADEHNGSVTSRHSAPSNRVRFAGPLDDRVIEDSGYTYSKTVLWAILIGISLVLIGIVVMSSSIYSLHKGEFHGALFSIAYHFCAAEGILGLSFINGWSTPMRKTHRQYAHVFLQTCTILLAVIGVIAISIPTITHSRSIHGISGLITLVLTGISWVVGPFLMSWVVGPFVLRGIRPLHMIHKTIGLLCFFMSTICLCSGIVSSEFSKWAGQGVNSALLGFIIFYSFIIIYTSCMKYVKMML